ncbi:MAG: hypothetical protein KDD47_25675, partial [Acidobacteria bacterium]|nr:hypothetical protein [Acidobacteriota bacterium]
MTWNPARIRLSIIRFPGLLLMSSTALLAGGCGPATTTHQIRGTYPPEPLHAHLPTVEAKSCNGVSTYRDLPPPPPPPAYPSCELWHHSAERLTNGHEEESLVRIIEFNDEGEVNETQRDAALRDIRATITAAGRGLVVVFAHGWHHGAQVCDDNLACFRRALMGLHSAQKTIDGMNHDGKRTDPAPVIGVFLAWRGEEFERFPGKQLSLFSRKGIAQRIGRNGARETLDRLDGLYRDLRASLETEGEDRRVRMISVGHSLGGAMLFTALQSKVQVRENGRRVLKLGEDGLPQGFGDMMVLVNPAVEAWEYKPFHRYSRSRNRVTRRADAPPILVSVGSTADQAVGAYFPIARLVQSLWHPTRPFRGVSNFLAMGRYWLHT